MMRVLVSGGRKFNRYRKIYNALVELGGKEKIGVVIHGAAPGADTLAEKAATALGIPTLPFPISKEEWRRLGYMAGPLRNQRMLDEGSPEILLAFPDPDSKGTWDMVRRVMDAKLPMKVYDGEYVWTETEIHRSKAHGKRKRT